MQQEGSGWECGQGATTHSRPALLEKTIQAQRYGPERGVGAIAPHATHLASHPLAASLALPLQRVRAGPRSSANATTVTCLP